MQNQELDMNEMSLREHLLAAQAASQAHHHLPSSQDPMRPHDPSNPHHEHNIDPAIAGHAYAMSTGESGGDDGNPDSKKNGAIAKRELSTSKRAAQNRAAQRAFRQRKEGYIKRLEEQVKDYEALERNYKAIHAENYQLRDYVINLQTRLIENQQDIPQPPPAIHLHPRADDPPAIRTDELPDMKPQPVAPMGQSAVNQLQAAAAAAQADQLEHGKHYLGDESYPRGRSGLWPGVRRGEFAGEDVGSAPASNGT